ncbi:Pyruvate kinase family protein [Lunatimonas lonarensis]|uniref:Pyruvate kinase n=1 Tax=Lunatimonas lonarensis TaxID=1232681 RepID=R7ZQ47_9BACT|nr:pyruvate kinase [Lunatimonas lonarensis]EON76212.1 Pyruvate kinase family protein [Lunatimonas lonarensis]
MKADPILIEQQLALIESEMRQACLEQPELIEAIHPNNQSAAKNLLHYLAFRSEDRTKLQLALHRLGLSALSNAESHILSQVQSVRKRLGHQYEAEELFQHTYPETKAYLARKANQLLGTGEPGHHPYIMVTLDPDMIGEHHKLGELLQHGMNVARINCAHGDQATWKELVETIRRASHDSGIPCRIYMDLAGPKIRTKFLGDDKKKKSLSIAEGELLYLAASRKGFRKKDRVVSPSVPEVLPYLRPEQRVLFDDGKVYGTIESKDKRGVAVRIRKYFTKKQRMKADKGINFPDSKIDIPALTASDRENLPFIVSHADLIGYSFVNTPEDLQLLRSLIGTLSENPPPVILKIETALSVRNLPALLLESMKDPLSGVMIARGDLAVETGFQKLAEIQDDILWVCEAAQIPVIWATQVLETLHKTGIATRSEITDAAQAALAECIMINKGPHTVTVIEYLKEIIHRSKTQRTKKRFLVGKLKLGKL